MAEGSPEIDALRGGDGSLDGSALRSILPYGEHFLFVDHVSVLTADAVEARFRIPEDSAYLRSHFVDLPLMPGVLIAEGLAQAASLIVRYRLEAPERHHVLGLEVERARFPAPARPGDALEYRGRLGAMNRRVARLEGEAYVEGTVVCRAKITVAIVDRDALRQRLTKT
ncbi:MAG: 3-hydroxyacyl-ACP dehydratase FabZ family protein [Thermoanaerobaculia bacterium]